jgi:hypothetical protein
VQKDSILKERRLAIRVRVRVVCVICGQVGTDVVEIPTTNSSLSDIYFPEGVGVGDGTLYAADQT